MKNDTLTHRAKLLRKRSTDAEQRLWYFLRTRRFQRFKFKRQFVIEPYIVDFICLHKKLIIELDGGQHAEIRYYDDQRTQFLKSKQYKVIRFWNHEVFLEEEAMLDVIYRELQKT